MAIDFVGARPGEKLHEELWNEGETVEETGHPKILRARRPPIDATWLEEELAELERLVDEGETLEVVARRSEMMRSPRRIAEPEPAHRPAAT